MSTFRNHRWAPALVAVAVTVAVIVMADAAVGAIPALPTSGTDAQAVGVLRGSVEDGEGGKPIEAARVLVRGPEGLSEELITDRSGVFQLRIHRLNDCAPSYYVDGIRQMGLDGGIDRYFTPGQVEMVEVYRGVSQLPGEFADNQARRCGAIAIWTCRGR